jgi:glycosyltransferase involved in cell wall biosynthesis
MMVSVVMITYAHASFILKAIEGVLSQKSDFEIELILANDCSPDNTDGVVKSYIKNHPKKNLVKYTRHENNKGMMGNFIWALEQCKGKYIALCEGDDYWTDPLKLQKQIDFLETNKEYSLCFHSVKILQPNGKVSKDYLTSLPSNYQTQESFALFGNYIHTPSVVFRNVSINYPEEIFLSPLGDLFLYALLSDYGKFHFIKDSMAVYRNGAGIWSKESEFSRHFKTAYVFALLSNVFSSKSNISLIYSKRVGDLIDNFRNEVTVDHLEKLCLNENIRKELFERLIQFKRKGFLKNVKSHIVSNVFKIKRHLIG